MGSVASHLKAFHEAQGEYHSSAASLHRDLSQAHRRMAALRKRKKADLDDDVDQDAERDYREVREELADLHEKMASEHLKASTFHGKAATNVAALDPLQTLPQLTARQPYLDRTNKAFGMTDSDAIVPDGVHAVIPPARGSAEALIRDLSMVLRPGMPTPPSDLSRIDPMFRKLVTVETGED